MAGSGGAASVNLSVAAGSDQTTGDSVVARNFENIDASALSTGLTITGSSAANNIVGTSGADTIDGNGGADVINASAGDDTVTYRGTELSIDGGAGVDTLVMRAAVTVDLSASDQTSGDGTSVSSFQNIDATGLSANLSIRGSSAANTILTGTGNDTIDGNGGADIVNAGAGADSVSYYGAETSIDGGSGTNTLVLRMAATLDLSAADQSTGDATTVANFQNVDASALTAAIAITGSAGANALTGGSGNDTLDGNGGADTLLGGDGSDTIRYRGTEALLDGGNAADTLVLVNGGGVTSVDFRVSSGADQTAGDAVYATNFENLDASAVSSNLAVFGSVTGSSFITGAGADTIDGGGGPDTINAGGGDDIVSYYGSESVLNGGTGNNTLQLRNATTIDLGVADVTVGDGVNVSGFINVDATALASGIAITGSAAANLIRGGAGNDTIDGAGGSDTIDAGSGNDTATARGSEASMDGGSDTDTLVLRSGTTITAVNFAVASGLDQTTGDITAIANFENLDASAAATGITVTGSSSANVLTMGSGNDVIRGGGGADVINAGGGNDTIDYLGSELSIDGGTGANTLVLKAATTVDLGAGDQTTGDSVGVSNFANIDASLLANALTLTGSAGVNIITGGSGDDTIDGAGGADTISAGAGADTILYRGAEGSIDGGSGSDTLLLTTSGGITAVDLSVAAGADQTGGDGVAVSNFENLDASALSSAFSVTGSAGANAIQTGSGNDTIRGGGGADVINAGAGDDTIDYWGSESAISGGAGANTLVLRAATTIDLAAADQTIGDITAIDGIQNVDGAALTALQAAAITGSLDANILTGGAGADTIDGAGGADVIASGAGNDTILYRGSEISIDGGTGSDTLVLPAGAGVTAVDFSVTAGSDQTAGDTVAVRNLENLDGSALAAALTVTGSSGANTIATGSGNDVIDGLGGADVINAGAGDDTVAYNGGEVSIAGGSGVNTLQLRNAVNVDLSLADQTTGDLATVTSFQNIDAASIASALTLTGSSGANAITAGSGADVIDGNGGADSVLGGLGNDTIVYRGAEALLDGEAGTNTLMLRSAATVNLGAADQTTGDGATVQNFSNVDASLLASGVSLTGSAGDNIIRGGSGADTIVGAGGADTIDSGAGNDSVTVIGAEASIDGGAGTDTLVLLAGTTITTANFAVSSGLDQTTGDSTLVANFENLTATAVSTALNVTGSASANSFNTGSGNDTIRGGSGADVIDAGGGNDTVDYEGSEVSINGGSGTNTLILRTAAAVNLGNVDQTTGDAVNVSNFANVDATSLANALTLTGSSGANVIAGGSGDDVIDGAGGADVVSANAGSDSVTYRGAELSIDGGSGVDTLVLAASGGITAVDLSVAAGADQTAGDAVAASNFENLNAAILAGAIAVTGSAAGNVITTGSGNDTIHGGAGADVIDAGAGNDTIDYWSSEISIAGGTGTNTLVLRAATTVNLAAADQTAGDVSTVTGIQNVDGSALTGLQSVSITGSSVANILTGGAGNDGIDGNGGADVIDGGDGSDSIMYRGTEVSINGGNGGDNLTLAVTSGITAVDLSVAAGVDQTSGDAIAVTNFESFSGGSLTSAITVTGSTGGNSISTGSGNDTIDGRGGGDFLDGGAGNDTITYYGTENAIAGGSGNNTLVLNTALTVNFAFADQSIGDLTTVTGFQNVNASAVSTDLTLTGSSAANAITGGSGADLIDGNAGADTIDGGAGDDVILYRATETVINGGSGVNTLRLMVSGAVINLANADQSTGDSANITNFRNVDASLLAAGQTANITGSSVANVITGGLGVDTIDGGGGADTIDAGGGNDTVTTRGTETLVDGGVGTNTLILLAGSTVTSLNLTVTTDQTTGDTVDVRNFQTVNASAVTTNLSITTSSNAHTTNGGSGNDTINGGGGADNIFGNGGDDTMSTYGSETVVDGGTGNNSLIVRSMAGLSAINLSVAAGSDQTTGDTASVRNFQNVDTTLVAGGFTVTGSTAANIIRLGNNIDVVDGNGGADVITTAGGDDTVTYRGTEVSIDAGSGFDRLTLGTLGTITTIDFSAADQTVGDSTLVSGFDSLTATAISASINLRGHSGTNWLNTGSGNDTIDGLGGYDSISAGAGDDRVAYYGTEERIDGGSGSNTLVMNAASIIALANTDQTTGDGATVLNFQNIDSTAVSAAMTIVGSTGANNLTTGAGNDTIDGNGGADSISSGGGDDNVTYRGTEASINGGTGSNTLILQAGVTVNLANADQTTGDGANVSNFSNIQANLITANLSLTGSSAANSITGSNGDDTIDGNGGADTLAAGLGNDTVTYRGTEASIDGGVGTDTLAAVSGSVTAFNLGSGSDQTTGDSAIVTGFENLNASALGAALTVTGSSAGNVITTGSGNDTVDGAGGSDVISTGGGNDLVTYRGSETSIDGGTGVNSLILTSAAFVNLANADQTSGDAVAVSNFQHVDGSSLSVALTLTGSSTANTISGGSGNDTIDGAGGADTVDAGAGNDTVTERGSETSIDGGLGNDTLIVAAGSGVTAVNLAVAAGSDQTTGDGASVANFESFDGSALTAALTVTGSSGANSLVTGSGADTINGGGGTDAINAGGGNDTVTYNGAETSIDGGSGTNTLVLASATTVQLNDLDQTSGDSTFVSNFLNIDGSALAAGVAITGTASNNVITGGSGADTINGAGGSDVITAGAGDDTVSYHGVESTLSGGSGSDTLVLLNTATVNLNNADQTSGDFVNASGFEHVDASALSTGAAITGSSIANNLTGGSGSDTIDGGGGADAINAGGGNDRVTLRGAETLLDGGSGIDTLVLATGSGVTGVNFTLADHTVGDAVDARNFDALDASAVTTALTVTGTTGGDTLTTGTGNDTIDGGGGADIVDAGDGDDHVAYRNTGGSLNGGAGTNTLVMTTAVTVNLANADQTTGESVTVSNFQNVDASGLGVGASLTGSSGANSLTGGSGNDTIDGGGGADAINAGVGDDRVTLRGAETTFDGGTGADTLVLAAGSGVTAVDFTLADQTVGDAVNAVNFESLDASAFSSALTVTGSSAANSLTGGSGNDTIDGGGGADAINAGGGNDRVTMRGAETLLDGGSGTDTLVVTPGLGVTAVNFSVAAGSDQTVGDVVSATNFESLDASGLSNALTITGSSSANTIATGSGNDTIDGGGGADIVDAGDGDDHVAYRNTGGSLNGGAGTNTLVMTTAVTVNLANADQTTGESVTVSNFQNVDASGLGVGASLTGSSGANSLTGGSGNDTIDGGGGADAISAGVGDDRVTLRGAETTFDGGTGADTLVLAAGSGVTAVDFTLADQTVGDAVNAVNFESLDASAFSSALTVTGSSAANSLTGGSGNDTIDGGGGADAIDAGGGNDRVTMRGAETLLDGGSGADTLVVMPGLGVTAVNFTLADQTIGDAVNVRNFDAVDASAVATALTVTGSSSGETITTGSGNDTIDGGGGADVVDAGAGDDRVSYYNSGGSLAGGSGVNTLVMMAAVTVNLANADQTTGESVTVSGFQNVDASALGAGASFTGSTGANSLTGGSGNDTIDGGGGADVISAGAGGDIVTHRGTEVSIDGGSGADALSLTGSTSITSVDFSVAAGVDQTTGDTVSVTNFEHLYGTSLTTSINVTATTGGNTINTGSGNDTINGLGGGDFINGGGGNDTISYHGSESMIAGGGGTNTLVMAGAATVNLANADQTTGDSVNVSGFQNVDASGLGAGVAVTGSSGANSLAGGSGADTIDGGGGADQLFGNGGDDLFLIDVSALSGGLTANGGSGSNRVNITGSGTVSDSQLLAALTNVQDIDFTAAGVDASVTLSGAQIAQIDGGGSNSLTMRIDAGDSVSISDNPANYTTMVSGNTTTYTIYDDATHTNVVAQLSLVA